MYGPVRRGKHVTLRPPVESDVPVCVQWLNDPEVIRFLGPRQSGMTIELEREFFKKLGEDANSVFWVIELEGRPIGTSSIFEIDWKNGTATTATLIGDKGVWRKGYGIDAMRVRAEYAFGELRLNKLNSQAIYENEGSRRAQLAVGYREVGIRHQERWREGRWWDMWLSEFLREDWEQSRSGQGRQ